MATTMSNRVELNRVDPFTFVEDLFRGFQPWFAETSRSQGFVPAVDARREEDDLVMKVDLPGIDPERDVDIELDGRVLTVSGERRAETETEGHREVRYGRFSRSVTLPADVAADAITADYTSGVLTVRVAGAYASQKPAKIRIGAAKPKTELAA